MKTLLLILFPILLTAQSQDDFYGLAGWGITHVVTTTTSDIMPNRPGLSAFIGAVTGLISSYVLNKYSWIDATHNQKSLVYYGVGCGLVTGRCYIDWRGKRLIRVHYQVTGQDYYNK